MRSITLIAFCCFANMLTEIKAYYSITTSYYTRYYRYYVNQDSNNCVVDINYCGFELWAFGFDNADSNTLYRCTGTGSTASSISRCNGGDCVKKERSNSYCLGKCNPNSLYCGSELQNLQGWSGGNYNDLYRCGSDGKSSIFIEKCGARCVVDSRRDSYCSTSCVANLVYCGHELQQSGFDWVASNSLYKCSAGNGENRNSVYHIKSCEGQCVKSGTSYCNQNCIIGRQYCAQDLARLEGWTVPIGNKNIYKCSNGSSTELVQACKGACEMQSGSLKCVQECNIGEVYCGHELNNLEGWSNFNDNTLYRCTAPRESEYIKSCKGVCRAQTKNSVCSQECTVDQLYCDYDLAQLEGWSPDDNANVHTLYQCINGSFAKFKQNCLHGCRDRKCVPECKSDTLYCGYELEARGFASSINSKYLYKCVNSKSVSLIQKCHKECINTSYSAFCSETCLAHHHYCGHQLPQYDDLKPNARYICSATPGQSPRHNGTCAHKCVFKKDRAICSKACKKHNLYCGHELKELEYEIDDANLQKIFRCQPDEETVLFVEQCDVQCVADHRKQSYCAFECKNNTLYCGHELHTIGYESGSPQDLYYCVNQTTIVLAERCLDKCVIMANENSKCVKNGEDAVIPPKLSCGIRNPDSYLQDPKLPMIRQVRGGHEVVKNSWPWMVSLKWRHNMYDNRCGGFIINADWVLLAAHCFYTNHTLIPKEQLVVTVGEHNVRKAMEKGEITFDIAELAIFPDYNDMNIQSGDIALVKLALTANYNALQKPICLPNNSHSILNNPAAAVSYEHCMVAGWGLTWGNSPPNILQVGDIEIFNNNKCNRFKGISNRVDFTYNGTTMICAGTNDPAYVVTCRGDSGGPLMCKDENDVWTAVGITSFGIEDACKTVRYAPTMAVFTRISYYMRWIEEQLNDSANIHSAQPLEKVEAIKLVMEDYEDKDW